MLQTNVREEYKITTLEVVKLIEDLISYLAVAKCTQLQNAQILKVFYKAAYSAKVKTEDLSNTLTLILSKTAQQQSSSIVSNRSIALITNKFGVALLTELAILNNANIALVDAMLMTKESQQKLEKNYFKVIDALTMTLIKNNNNLLGTVNSYIKLRRLRALGKKAQLKKTRDEEKLAKAKKEKEKKEAQKRETYLDINPKDDSEDEEATTAKDLAREQKERLKALLNAKQSLCKSRDSNRTLHSRRLIDAYILYFKELLSNNSRIFANAIGIGKTRAIVLAIEVQNARVESNATEHNAVNNDNKLCSTKGERTFYCANSLSENISRLTKEEAIEMRIDTTNAIFKALAAANKLVALRSYVLGGVDYRETFIIVCSFRKVDKHVFRAYNTISVTAQRTIIRKGSSYVEKRAILLSNILEKEGLNELEASRRIIFNCFKMQAIASYSALATLKAAQFKTYSSCKVKRFTLNSVKDLFTNLSKDYFLVREARAITKSSLKFQNLLNLCSKRDLDRPWIIVALIAFAEAIILTEATHVVIIEPQDRQNTQD
ncbi:hypothetical protein HBI69_023750 [Parastagonospora nodorum]|nr:hypothetical protein HBI69_023750 [Parastagonospora nodorum]